MGFSTTQRRDRVTFMQWASNGICQSSTIRPNATRNVSSMPWLPSRTRIGDFQMLVSTTPAVVGQAIWRRGNCWRVDLCYLMNSGEPWPSTPREDSDNRSQWFEEQLGRTERVPLYNCDGQRFGKTNPRFAVLRQSGSDPTTLPPQILCRARAWATWLAQATSSFLVAISRFSRKAGWEFTFDETPEDNLGLVVIKRSARLATATPR